MKNKKKVSAVMKKAKNAAKTFVKSAKAEVESVVAAVADMADASPASHVVEQKNDFYIVPLGDRVIVKPFTAAEVEKKNDFGIIIPETITKERPEQGRVVAVGEGRYDNGKIIPVKVKVGDKVVFSRYGFEEVKDGADEYYILKEDSILAIIR